MGDKVKIAAVQINPQIMQNRKNLNKVLSALETAAGVGAELIVFPECALTGYVFFSRDEAKPFMETIPGPATEELSASCKKRGVYVVVGLLEKEGDRCFNAAALIGPGGLVGKYRKNHLPFLGIDRFVEPGDIPFEVHKTPIGNIGILICYDCTFPESARVLSLLGADILALPTNWPLGREKASDFVVKTRAYENKVYLVAADRVGEERGTKFIGNSRIIDTLGNTLAQANSEDEQTIYAEVSLAEARHKRIVIKAGEFEVDYIGDRRPELYGKIAESRHD